MGVVIDDYDSRRQKYVAGLLIRIVVCIISVGVFAITASLVQPDSRHHFLFAILILLLLIGINYPFWVLGRNRQFPLGHFYGHWAVDLFLVTLILHMLGGIELPCGFVAYMIMILTSAVFLSQRASYIVATGSVLSFDALVLAENSGLLVSYTEIWDHEYTAAAQVVILIASNVFFYLFAYLAGSLSEELKRANVALAQAQGALQDYNRTLERSVRQRTEALEEKNREIEEFVHIVTHDLRNVSVGASEVARRLALVEGGALSARGQRYASNLLEDTRRMNQMLTHLLALFRVDHERERVESVDMAALARTIIGSNARRLEEKNVSITVGALPSVLVDPLQVTHVMANLIDNAIKYSGDKRAPTIAIECADIGHAMRFCVRDNGIGMPPEQKARVFQMYHRGPQQRVGGVDQEGQGVGLTITKRIVERWGGQIWVESEEGQGSAFFFTCPKEARPEPRSA